MEPAWLEQAKQLACGCSTKIMCCASSPSMMISHSQMGYTCFCFKCKGHQFVSHGTRTISEIARHKREYIYSQTKEIKLPHDYTQNIPKEFCERLFKYGISYEEATAWGIGYSEYFNRIVIPVYESVVQNAELLAVQMRAIRKDQEPKYLNLQHKGDRTTMFWCTGYVRHSDIVITEDVLSAIKVHDRIEIDTVSLLGSNLTAEKATKIAKDYMHVYIWLDGDKAGKLGAIEAEKQLFLQGVPNIYRITSEKDPKEYTKSDIEHFIKYEARKC